MSLRLPSLLLLFVCQFLFPPFVGAAVFSIEENDFRLINTQNRAQNLGSFAEKKAVVLLAWPGECAQREEILNWFAKLEKKVKSSSGVIFLWLNSSLPQDRQEINRLIKGRFQSSVMMDFSQTVSRSFHFKFAGDYLVLGTDPWETKLEGHWNDGGLEVELQKILGKALPKFAHQVSRTPSCPLVYQDFSGLIWNPGLARTFFRNCVACHMQREDLDIFRNDQDIFNWSAMNRQATRLYRMPMQGGDNDPENSNCMSGRPGFRLQQEDQRLIQNWLEAGSPHPREGSDFTTALRKEMNEKARQQFADLEEPDFIWKMPRPFIMEAKSPNLYQVVRVAGPLTEDADILGYEINFNQNIVEHINVIAFPKEQTSWIHEADHTFKSVDVFHKMAVPFAVSPPRTGGGLEYNSRYQMHAQKGDFIYFHIYYKPSGRREENLTEMKVFLNKKKKDIPKFDTLVFKSQAIYVPEGSPDSTQKVTEKFSKNSYIVRMFLHAHESTSSVEVYLKRPGEKEKVICRVPYFAGSFQEMIEPVFVPKNSELTVIYRYDHSKHNSMPAESTHILVKGRSMVEEVPSTRIYVVDRPSPVDSCWDSDLGCPRFRPKKDR